MSRGKTGLIVLVLIAAMFFLFIAILFGSSTKRQGVIDRKAELDAKLDAIAKEDITIYWIGDAPPAEMEHLLPVIKILPPESVSKDTLPVKSTTFHFTERNEAGLVVNEDIPREYSKYMVIFISGNPMLSSDAKSALLDCASQNGVPVIAVGDEASELLGEVLSYRRFKKGPGSSLLYSRGSIRYKENPLPEEAVKSGGMDLSEALPEVIYLVTGLTPAAEETASSEVPSET